MQLFLVSCVSSAWMAVRQSDSLIHKDAIHPQIRTRALSPRKPSLSVGVSAGCPPGVRPCPLSAARTRFGERATRTVIEIC